MKNSNFKLAIVSNEDNTINRHFGSANFYYVFSIENGVVINKERRDKFCAHAPGTEHNQHSHGCHSSEPVLHGLGVTAGDKHHAMLANVLDCQYMIAGGMGQGIYNHLINAGITPVITDISAIDEAVKAVIDNTIINHIEKLH